jgi:hypothetical protein
VITVAKTDSLGTDARELVDLVVGYAKQETLDPIKKLGKTVALGIVGAVALGLGVVFLSLAALRAMQSETEAFDDNLTFLPYVITMALLLIGAGIAWKGLGPGKEDGR